MKSCIAFLMLLAAAWSAGEPSWAADQKVALLVGINTYDARGLADKPLQFAERDVEELAVELKKQGDQVRVLKGSSTGSDRAEKTKIDAAVSELLNKRTARDIVLIGFAGHGQQMPLLDAKGRAQKDERGKELEDAYFCPVDAVRSDPATLISLTRLMQTLDDRGGINLVLVDACRDNPDPGRSTRSISGNELNGRLPANTSIAFSCSAGQQALETKDAGGGHGVFFHLVIQGLRGDAAKKNGDVTWSSLIEYVRDNTNDRVREWFPERAELAAKIRKLPLDEVLLQTPHELKNLVSNPVLARLTIAPLRPFEGKAAGETRDDNGLKLKLVWCPPGRFTMGTPKTEEGHQSNEDQVDVTLSNGFWMGQTEVTQGLFQSVQGTAPWKGQDNAKDGANYAASYVRHNDAVSFCQKLTSQERAAGRLPAGWAYRLPREAEWEYACRAGTKTAYSFGDSASLIVDYAWFDENAYEIGEKYAHQVGLKKPNAWGLKDMHGNVWEWCGDWYAAKLAGGTDARGPLGGSSRVCRGGSFLLSFYESRVGMRNYGPSDHHNGGTGFRVVVCVE